MIMKYLSKRTALLGSAGVALLSWTGCGGDEVRNAAPVGDDLGRIPWVVNIEEITLENTSFRSARWTGQLLQMTLMSLKPGEEIGLELHPDVDQFIRIEQVQGKAVLTGGAAHGSVRALAASFRSSTRQYRTGTVNMVR
jgi:hypothetical protein